MGDATAGAGAVGYAAPTYACVRLGGGSPSPGCEGRGLSVWTGSALEAVQGRYGETGRAALGVASALRALELGGQAAFHRLLELDR